MLSNDIKRSLFSTCAVLSANSFAGNVHLPSDFDLDIYGVAAISAVNYNTTDVDHSSNGFQLENKSRIGFRAYKDIIEGVKITMQIESGYIDNYDYAHTSPGGYWALEIASLVHQVIGEILDSVGC